MNPQTFNLYTYGLNNPVRYLDPTGESTADFSPIAPSGWNFKQIQPPLEYIKLKLFLPIAAVTIVLAPGWGELLIETVFELELSGKTDETIKGYRAVSDSEMDDIQKQGFRSHPEGKSMEDKWFSESREGAEEFTKIFPEQKNIVEADVPKSVYDKSYKHSNIDNTGPGFAVPEEQLPKIKPILE